MSQLFAKEEKSGLAAAPMGTRVNSIGRYKMPLLPGEAGTKAGGDWVPRGIQSMTNLAGSISDSKALGDWLIQQTLIGMGLSPDLRDELWKRTYAAKERGIDFQSLKETPEGQAFREQLMTLAERAKDVGGGNSARDAGIVRHDIWEVVGKTGELSGTEQINAEITALRQLLDAAGFEVIPDLVERTVRNTEVRAAGRFDNILLHTRTGKLHMADLKTKRKPFWTFLEIDAQLAGYAYARLMLQWSGQDVHYVDGPAPLGVDLKEGVVLHMPSDGSEPRLRRADLEYGWGTLQLARQVCDRRSYGRSAARIADSWWPTS